jgi:hypothetical protein
VRALLWNGVASACEAARLRASLALDGDLEEIQLLLLQRHLDRCPECLGVVGGMRSVTTSIRSAPLEVRPPAAARGRQARRLPWASIGVAVAALAVGAVTLPQPPGPSGAGGEAPRLAAPPPPLPIGQRSAGDDFLPASRSGRRS